MQGANRRAATRAGVVGLVDTPHDFSCGLSCLYPVIINFARIFLLFRVVNGRGERELVTQIVYQITLTSVYSSPRFADLIREEATISSVLREQLKQFYTNS